MRQKADTVTMFFSLDPGGLRAFEPTAEIVEDPTLDLGELLASSAGDLLGERARTLTRRRVGEGDPDAGTDSTDDSSTTKDISDSTDGGSPSDLANQNTGTTVLTERGSLVVIGYAARVGATDLVGWLATTAGLHGVSAENLDAAMGNERDLATAHTDLVGHDAPERFVDLPRLVVVGQSFEPDVRASLDVLRASGAPIDVRSLTILSTSGNERVLTIESVDDQGQGGTRRPPRRLAPPGSARSKTPVIDLAGIADLGTNRPPAPAVVSADPIPPGPPPPAPG